MKATKLLLLLLLVGVLGSSCATISQLNSEYEEEMARVERMSPEDKAEWEKAQQEKEAINWNEYIGGDND